MYNNISVQLLFYSKTVSEISDVRKLIVVHCVNLLTLVILVIKCLQVYWHAWGTFDLKPLNFSGSFAHVFYFIL